MAKKPKAARITAVADETAEQRFNRLEKEVARLRRSQVGHSTWWSACRNAIRKLDPAQE